MNIRGNYFPPASSRALPATLAGVETQETRLDFADAAPAQHWHWHTLKVSARVGDITRRISFPDGGVFETSDNDTVDAAEKIHRGLTAGYVMHRMEKLTRWTVIAVLLAAILLYAGIVYGIPAAARSLASITPASVETTLTRQTLEFLDGSFLKPSTLNARQKAHAQSLFAETLKAYPGKVSQARLVFRASPTIGPNALALPDGTIIMTDEMWTFFEHDDEAAGVFAHEIGHVEKHHGLRALYQASVVAAALTVIAGDVSQISNLAVLLPTVLLQSGYSRAFEREADVAARDTLLRLDRDPGRLAQALSRLMKKICKQDDCGSGWLSSHPDVRERVRLLTEKRGP